MRDTVLSIQTPRRSRWRALIAWLGACFAVALTSTLFTASAIPGWYAGLAKPSFNPPNQIFGPVWTVLYAAMGIAAWQVWMRHDSDKRTQALLLFITQLLLNFGWSLIFFGWHQIGAAFIEILMLWLAIVLTTIHFFRVSRAAGWLMTPYLCWVSFASVLNWEIWRLN